MQLDHRVCRIDQVGPIHLDFIILLSMSERCSRDESQKCDREKTTTHKAAAGDRIQVQRDVLSKWNLTRSNGYAEAWESDPARYRCHRMSVTHWWTSATTSHEKDYQLHDEFSVAGK